jgi:hypothetical protein
MHLAGLKVGHEKHHHKALLYLPVVLHIRFANHYLFYTGLSARKQKILFTLFGKPTAQAHLGSLGYLQNARPHPDPLLKGEGEIHLSFLEIVKRWARISPECSGASGAEK